MSAKSPLAGKARAPNTPVRALDKKVAYMTIESAMENARKKGTPEGHTSSATPLTTILPVARPGLLATSKVIINQPPQQELAVHDYAVNHAKGLLAVFVLPLPRDHAHAREAYFQLGCYLRRKSNCDVTPVRFGKIYAKVFGNTQVLQLHTASVDSIGTDTLAEHIWGKWLSVYEPKGCAGISVVFELENPDSKEHVLLDSLVASANSKFNTKPLEVKSHEKPASGIMSLYKFNRSCADTKRPRYD